MKNTSFWRKLLEEILVNREYTVDRIAEELDMSREIIADLKLGNFTREPTFSEGIKLLVLHCKVRSDLHH